MNGCNPKEYKIQEVSTTSRHQASSYYSIGDKMRSPSHMIIEPTYEQATEAVTTLQKHDYAFVKRGDGSYSYAILACRSSLDTNLAVAEEDNGDNNEEEFMIFVMDTKKIHRKHWCDKIRLVS